MSGICGIIDLTGAALNPVQIRRMTDVLERRGPEGTHIWQDGAVAFGHTLLATTPEALHEKQPFTHIETGCVITADLRLDNRDELLTALGLAAQKRIIGDAEIALHVYLKWGEDCPRHLLGDFALAIWDPRAGRLFCVRDPMGMKQLIYCHIPGRLFAFATEPRAVLEAEGVPRRINELRIADYLGGGLEAVDATSTFFEQVYRMPPAHIMAVGHEGMTQRRYWRLKAGPELKLASDRDYAEAFLEVFTKAVSVRLRAPAGTVGSMLSGGMDSGSIVAIACRLFADEGRGPLPTFSGVGPDPKSCAETHAIHVALTMPNLAPTLVNWAEMESYAEELIAMTRKISDPFDGSMTMMRAICLHANKGGIKVLLDGAGGDVCFSNSAHVPRLIRQLHWIEAWREAAAENRFWGEEASTLRSWLTYQRQAWTPVCVSRIKRELLGRYGKDRLGLCTPEFAARVNLASRKAMERRQWPTTRLSHGAYIAHVLQQGFQTAARERYDRTGSASSIEMRDPFMDTRVMQFCVSLPLRQLTQDGRRKVLLRRSMETLMPDAIRRRTGKEHLGWTFSETMTSHWKGWNIFDDEGQVGNYAKVQKKAAFENLHEKRLHLTYLKLGLINSQRKARLRRLKEKNHA